MNIGEKIKKLRTEHKLSTRQLAEKLDISQAHISKMESNKNLPSLPMLEKIADTFGVHITYFFDHEKVIINGVRYELCRDCGIYHKPTVVKMNNVCIECDDDFSTISEINKGVRELAYQKEI